MKDFIKGLAFHKDSIEGQYKGQGLVHYEKVILEVISRSFRGRLEVVLITGVK